MKTLFTTILLFFGLINSCMAQDERTNQNKNFLITEDGVKEIVSYELIFSASTCNSNTGILKAYFSEIRSNLIERGMNVKMNITDSGNGVISFDTATIISLDTINTWLESQGVTAMELSIKISKN